LLASRASEPPASAGRRRSRPPTAERRGLRGRSLARASPGHAREGFDRLSPNGLITTAERKGLPARSLASAETAHERKGFDKLSPNVNSAAPGLRGRQLARASLEPARESRDKVSPNGAARGLP
jgi:hypothetical protein